MGQILGRRRNFAISCGLILFFVLLLLVYSPDPLLPSKSPPSTRVSRIKLRNPLMFRTKEQTERPTTFAESVLYVIMIPSERAWAQIPLLSQTVLLQYPHTLVTSDSGLVIGPTTVHDVLAGLDLETLESDLALESYRIERYGNDEGWGWPIQDYLPGNPEHLITHVRQKTLKLALKKLLPQHQWVVLTNADSYLSPHFNEEVSLTNTRFASSERFTHNDTLLLSKEAFQIYAESNKLPDLAVVEAHNLSSTLVTPAQWCQPIPAFASLQRWETQTLFGRDNTEIRSTDHNLGSAFYRDFILPFVADEKMNWAINPTSTTNSISSDSEEKTTKAQCKQLCKKTTNCLAWQWTSDGHCSLETEGVKRGIAVNVHYNKVNKSHPLVVSGYMIDRIRSIRLHAPCDPLKIDNQGELYENEFSSEGYVQRIRDRAKFKKSPVLQAMRAYEDSLDNPPSANENYTDSAR